MSKYAFENMIILEFTALKNYKSEIFLLHDKKFDWIPIDLIIPFNLLTQLLDTNISKDKIIEICEDATERIKNIICNAFFEFYNLNVIEIHEKTYEQIESITAGIFTEILNILEYDIEKILSLETQPEPVKVASGISAIILDHSDIQNLFNRQI
jgi:hypothetical protein